MNRRTFIKLAAQLLGLPVAAAVLPLPKAPIDAIIETPRLLSEKIRLAKTILDTQVKGVYWAVNPPLIVGTNWNTNITYTAEKVEMAPGCTITSGRINDH